MTTTFKLIIAAASLALLASCATGAKFSSIRQGMSKAEVEDIMGQPDSVQKLTHVTLYKYQNRLDSNWSYDRTDLFVIFDPNGNVHEYGRENYRQAVRPVYTPVYNPPAPASVSPTLNCTTRTVGATTYTDCN